MLETTVAGKVIKNDDRMLDLLNYAIGSIKCFTMTSRMVQEETVSNQVIPVLSMTIDKLLKSKYPANKKAMILVQITGALRNLANVERSHFQISQHCVKQMCDIFFDNSFNTGKELMLNIARLLSKVSLDIACAE